MTAQDPADGLQPFVWIEAAKNLPPSGPQQETGMIWEKTHRACPRARLVADRHYNRQKVGSPQFVPPGRCVVLYAENNGKAAFWVTSWPYAKYVKHDWAGAWVNSAFRNEGAGLSSELIRDAISATLVIWPEPPDLGLITFVDRSKVRKKRDFGRCYRKAGFKIAGETKGGLLALQLLPIDFPKPEAALFMQQELGQ